MAPKESEAKGRAGQAAVRLVGPGLRKSLRTKTPLSLVAKGGLCVRLALLKGLSRAPRGAGLMGPDQHTEGSSWDQSRGSSGETSGNLSFPTLRETEAQGDLVFQSLQRIQDCGAS